MPSYPPIITTPLPPDHFSEDWEIFLRTGRSVSYTPPSMQKNILTFYAAGIIGHTLLDLGCGPKPVSSMIYSSNSDVPKPVRILVDSNPGIHRLVESEPDNPIVLNADLRDFPAARYEDGLRQAQERTGIYGVTAVIMSAITDYFWDKSDQVMQLIKPTLLSGGIVFFVNKPPVLHGQKYDTAPDSNMQVAEYLIEKMGYEPRVLTTDYLTLFVGKKL
ncbi:hypothetical protein HZB88_02995 [archaeon]|nr:hypothetical protein [archaeon]